jgi:hypothetical protein
VTVFDDVPDDDDDDDGDSEGDVDDCGSVVDLFIYLLLVLHFEIVIPHLLLIQ